MKETCGILSVPLGDPAWLISDVPVPGPSVAFNSRIVGALEREIARIPGVIAIFLGQTSSVYSVFTVIEDFDPDTMEAVYCAEDRVQEEFPMVTFDFAVRLAQGQDPTMVVPMDQRAVFIRSNG